MNYNLLGKSDLKISQVSFGCMSLGNDHPANAKLLHAALDGGINFFDTADIYDHGENEVTIGKAFRSIRNKVILATKVGNVWKKDGTGLDWNPTKAHILKSIDESLQRLQTDFIDLYQLHGGTIHDPIGEVIEAFEFLKQQGKIRYYGISSIRPNVIREYVNHSSIVSVMMQYSLLDRRPEESCLELLEKANVGVLARGTLAKGLLAGKPPGSFLQYSVADVSVAQEAIQKISGSQRTATESALRFVLQTPPVKTAVVGIRTAEQLRACINASNTPVLTDEEMSTLRKALSVLYYQEHR